jgi:amino acid adenylation domain-containing protein
MQDKQVQGFRLSPQQRRLWWLQQAAEGVAFRVQAVVRIEGDLDAAGLWSAILRVVAGTEVLRTSFQSLGGMALPLQVIRKELPPHRLERDLSSLAVAERRAAVDALLRDEWAAPYAPESDSPLRFLLATLEPGLSLMAVTLPALCADRAGAVNLVREIARVYGSGGTGEAAGPEMQYVDLAEWQNDLLEAEETRAGREHWAARERSWQGGLGCELPAGRDGRFMPASLPVAISPLTAGRLESLARGGDVSVASLLLAAWGLLLGRWRGGETPPLGLAADGRRYRELADAVGPFARVLPLTSAAGGASLRAAAGQAEAAARQARAFQESFEWENGAFLPWTFRFEEAPESLAVQSVRFTFEAVRDCLERFELLLDATRREGELSAELQYDRSRFDPADLERLAAQLAVFLDQLTADPDASAADLPVLGEDERQELLVRFNAERSPEPPAAGVHEVIADQAVRTPEALAVIDDKLALSYAELDRRANRLAGRLRAMGIGPEARVALCVERSAATVVGLLGILKAGGAYVPLEPGQPQARLARMLAEVGAAALVAPRHRAAELPAGPWPLVCLEDALEAGEEDAQVASGVAPENLAYVLFTSGSTGQPKGVAVEHRQLLNYVRAVSDRLDFPAGAVFATVTTFAADLGHTMVFPALCGGGCLLVASQEQARDPEALAELFSRHPVDCLKVVPSHLAALLGGSRPERLLPRRRLVVGGEASRPELIGKVRALAPECRVFNHYGPTETTVGVLTHPFTEGRWDGRWTTLPLGRPLANTRVYLLDRRLQPVPAWVPGEIYIGGAGVARGYLGQPALTAERFVPDHVGGEPGSRLYRTGDLARYLPGTGIEFLGRADHQVKIRGFRIELGEIEAEIRRHPAVRETVVLAREDEPGDRRLVAYVAGVPDGAAAVEELRAHLAANLPDYMVPSAIVLLPALPLTANGKLDRHALPAPDRGGERGAAVAPRTPVEELLAGLWAQVLRRGDIGVDDSFFDLGGHSLLATQLFSRMREAFGADLPLSLLFAAPTVAGLAAGVEAALRAGAGVQAPPIVAVPRLEEGLPLSFAQQRHWFLQQFEPGSSLYNLRSTVRLQGALDVGVLERSLREILSRHEVLRTSFSVVDGRPVQAISESIEFDVPVIDLRQLSEEARRETAGRLTEEQRERPFDLTQAPLLRVVLLRLAEDEHLAVLTLHHIVADGWSLGILVQELTALYAAFVAGRPSPLRPLPLQYADFSQWQREWLRGEVVEAHLDYWRRQLAGVPSSLQLPFDFPRPAVPSVRSRRQPLEIPASVAERLRALGRESGATLFQILLTGFQVLLHACTGQTDVVVGSPIANRNRLETEGLIGCFINALALRGDLTGDPTFRELLARVRRAVIEAHTHEDLPFDKLVEELNPERGEGQPPFFQVVFSYGTPRPPLVVPGLTITPVETENAFEAKYDLILLISQADEGLEGALTYSTDLFKPSTIARMAARFEALLRAVAARPEAHLRELVESAEEEERTAALARAEELRQARRRSLIAASAGRTANQRMNQESRGNIDGTT